MTHDPRRVTTGLRDHLSRHDKPIAFLFGAGSSSAITKTGSEEALVPSIASITALCEEHVKQLGEEFSSAWDVIGAESLYIDGDASIEAILSRVRLKIDAVGEGETLAGLDASALRKMEDRIRGTIAQAVQPSETQIPEELPHHSLARWIGRTARERPVEIFTTNYDVLLERALEDERVAVFDGFAGAFRPFFSPESLAHSDAAPGASWTRLWKIHGSINWSWIEIRGARRIVRTMPSDDGELILPSFRKYDESRKQPYVAILDRLSRFLSQDDALLVTCGFSFSDQHINAVIFDALGRPSRTHAISLQFSDPPESSSLVQAALRLSNLEVLGATQAWIGGIQGEWKLSEPVTTATAESIDLAFDSDAEPEPDKASLTGQFRLGDFRRFCRFLASMTPMDTS